MSAESIQKFLLELADKFKPFQIKTSINIKSLNQTIIIGPKTYSIKNGEIIIGEKPTDKIPLTKDNEGFVRPIIEGIELEGASDSKEENIKMLDIEEKVFTRSDIGGAQLNILSVEKDQEIILKTLKPILQLHKNGVDLGALLSAISIIKIEDKRENHELYTKLHSNYSTCYKKRGAMIYNLLRSNILQSEILVHLNKLKEVYGNPEDVKMHFLIYWDSILETGYPTACFVKEEDCEETLHKEIKWRLEKEINRIYVYSRTINRNKNTEKWCRSVAKSENCHCNKIREYVLGFTPAIKFRITK